MSYLCHLICVFVCMCVRGKGAGVGGGGVVERLRPPSLLLIGNPLCSCPQGHFLLFTHLPGNPPVTPWPSMSASRQIRGFPWKQRALLHSLTLSLTPATLLLIQTHVPFTVLSRGYHTHTHADAQTNYSKHTRKKRWSVSCQSPWPTGGTWPYPWPCDSTIGPQPDVTW